MGNVPGKETRTGTGAVTALSSARWSGWFRPSPAEPWRRIVSAGDGPACWSALLSRGLPSGDLLVAKADVDQNQGRQR
jgi:hypothetical protein